VSGFEIRPGGGGCGCGGCGGEKKAAPVHPLLGRALEGFEVLSAESPHDVNPLRIFEDSGGLPEPVFQGPGGQPDPADGPGGVLVDPFSSSFSTEHCRYLNDLVKTTFQVMQYEQNRLDALREQLRVLDAYRASPPGTPLFFGLIDPCGAIEEAARILTVILGRNPGLDPGPRDALNQQYLACVAYQRGSSGADDRLAFARAVDSQRRLLEARIGIQLMHARQATDNYLVAFRAYLAHCGPPGFFLPQPGYFRPL
jgi:hypothetical protein